MFINKVLRTGPWKKLPKIDLAFIFTNIFGISGTKFTKLCFHANYVHYGLTLHPEVLEN